MTLREHLASLRRIIDASSFYFEPTRNSPRAILDRIRCHPGDFHAVLLQIHETNPWEGPVEATTELQRGMVEVSWLTPGRSARVSTFSMS